MGDVKEGKGEKKFCKQTKNCKNKQAKKLE